MWKYFILICLTKLSSSQYSVHDCSGSDQELVYKSAMKAKCDLRYVTVDIDISNHTGISQVIPSHTVVKRCGGSCWAGSHTCHPTKSRMVEVEALVVSTTWGEGRWTTQCSTFQIKEDLECGCGCTVRPEDCNDRQYYKSDGCQCFCKNRELRNSCVQQQDKYWDNEACACLCHPSTWRPCSTGYMFDGQETCSCVPIFLLASPSVVMIVAVALCSSIGLLVLLLLSRKSRLDDLQRRESLARVLEEEER